MFTGLVEGSGKIVALVRAGDGLQLTVSAPFDLGEVRLGDSMAVSGPCLTVVALKPPQFTVDVSAETLKRTNFAWKRVGDRVNLERALRVGDRLGGHLVTGHIDCVAAVAEKKPGPQSVQMAFRLPSGWMRYVIEKGSIAVEGVSLTVNQVSGASFGVNLIPYTAQHTTLLDLKVGDRVNIETDIIGKYVEKLLSPRPPTAAEGITPEFLATHGIF